MQSFAVVVKTAGHTLRCEVKAKDCHAATFLAHKSLLDALSHDFKHNIYTAAEFETLCNAVNSSEIDVTVREVRD